MKRREIFAGNWKMNTTAGEGRALVRGIIDGLTGIGDREVIVFPPAVYAAMTVDLCKGTKVDVGIQNMYFEESGAFTGEISPLMVKDLGCRYILIGHSERRHVFGETDEEVKRKVQAALKAGIEPVVCVGELLDEREQGKTDEVIRRQIQGAFRDVSESELKTVIIAYEPVWAIGTGRVATPEIAEEVHGNIRSLISELYSEKAASAIPVLYGGSVKPDNIAGLYAMENIDGVLVGGASLKADSFLDIIRV